MAQRRCRGGAALVVAFRARLDTADTVRRGTGDPQRREPLHEGVGVGIREPAHERGEVLGRKELS